MIIQHNLSAMIAGDANLRNVAGLKKKTEKLSTGYKINRAADNASGLSVSEKMRSQIRGLSQATSNANDAISLMQTAEGGLQETEDILQRMRELAVQSANGTYTDEDRAHLQGEVDALKGEIDRISESTEFNEMKLLSGEVSLSLETKVPTNDYGARYGSINYDLDIGGGKIYVTSDIAGMYLKFTTGASGKGGENAYYEDDTTDGLTQHITINLVEGETYTDDQIQKLIDNANIEKCAPAAGGAMTFRSEVGQIKGAEAVTGNGVSGTNSLSNLKSVTGVADENGNIVIDFTSIAGTGRNNSDLVDLFKPITLGIYNDKIIVEKNYLETFKLNIIPNNSLDTESSRINSITFYISDDVKEDINNQCTFTDYVYLDIDEYLDNYSDEILDPYETKEYLYYPNFEFSIEGDSITVGLKSDYLYGDANNFRWALKDFFEENGLDYKVTEEEFYVVPVFNEADLNKIDNKINNIQTTKEIVYKKTNNPWFVTGSASNSSTFINGAATGTIPGIRQTAEGDLSALLINSGSGTEVSSDYITFTADTYGKAEDYDSVVKNFVISTEQDMSPGRETVEVDEDTETATLHLATGTHYTNDDIERLLKKAGLNYKVSLTDKVSPDGNKDGSVYFNTAGSVTISETTAGQGVGIESVADPGDRIIFQIGANGTEDQQVGMDIVNASSGALGVADVDVSTQDGANSAIEDIDKAIKTVSAYRAKMGALQNRMEKSVNSLNTSNENLTSAESQIRDTDMAAEMVEYQKNNILQQASQSMLAQANQQTNGVLSLLG